MKVLKQISAAIMLSFGFIFLMVSVSEIPKLNDKTATYEQKDETGSTFAGGLMLGVPFSAAGVWMFWGMHQEKRKQKQQQKQQQKQLAAQRLETTFYRLVEANQGRITLLQFAKAAELSPEKAKEYLDKKAIDFNANFEANSEGSIFYLFPV
jgi:uncharacterized protein HemX